MSKERMYIPISWVSTLGICETQLADKIAGKVSETSQMRAGTAGHEYLYQNAPKMTTKEIIEGMLSGRSFEAREVTVYDSMLWIDGRIDCLELTGRMRNGKSQAIIIDDKYPGNLAKNGLSLYRKLQLASYAVAISNSVEFGRICEVVGAKIQEREASTNAVVRTLDVTSKQLSIWETNVSAAVKEAWDIYKKVKEPEHKRFDVETGTWLPCARA